MQSSWNSKLKLSKFLEILISSYLIEWLPMKLASQDVFVALAFLLHAQKDSLLCAAHLGHSSGGAVCERFPWVTFAPATPPLVSGTCPAIFQFQHKVPHLRLYFSFSQIFFLLFYWYILDTCRDYIHHRNLYLYTVSSFFFFSHYSPFLQPLSSVNCHGLAFYIPELLLWLKYSESIPLHC